MSTSPLAELGTPELDTSTSRALFDRASAAIPGGVNSPVRAFTSVGGTPRFMASARGPWLTDADGHRYVDLICSWGPMILGHAHPAVVEAVREAAGGGLSFGAPTLGRDRARRGDHRAGRAGRAGAAGQLGHRGDDERRPARPRDHRPHGRRQVRRLLPRPRRRPARPGRLGGRDARPAHQPGRHRRPGRRHDRAALQRPRRRARRVRAARRRDRLRDHRGRRGQHGRDRPAARASTPGSRSCAPRTARC